jgi:hypothetical protein
MLVPPMSLDVLLTSGDPEAAAVVHGAIESFAQEFALVIQRFLKVKGWKDVERLVIGGGFVGRRVGELAVGRASVLLKAQKIKVEITTIRNDPDEAGLLGAIQLAPPWIFFGQHALGGLRSRHAIPLVSHGQRASTCVPISALMRCTVPVPTPMAFWVWRPVGQPRPASAAARREISASRSKRIRVPCKVANPRTSEKAPRRIAVHVAMLPRLLGKVQ